jgi:hypothetical protein
MPMWSRTRTWSRSSRDRRSTSDIFSSSPQAAAEHSPGLFPAGNADDIQRTRHANPRICERNWGVNSTSTKCHHAHRPLSRTISVAPVVHLCCRPSTGEGAFRAAARGWTVRAYPRVSRAPLVAAHARARHANTSVSTRGGGGVPVVYREVAAAGAAPPLRC